MPAFMTQSSREVPGGRRLRAGRNLRHALTVGAASVAMLCVAGSTKIGKRVITSGQTGIIDHRVIEAVQGIAPALRVQGGLKAVLKGVARRLLPDAARPQGMHTLSAAGDVTIVDGSVRAFAPQRAAKLGDHGARAIGSQLRQPLRQLG